MQTIVISIYLPDGIEAQSFTKDLGKWIDDYSKEEEINYEIEGDDGY